MVNNVKGIERDTFYRHSLEGIAKVFQQYQKHFDDSLSHVRIDVDRIFQENEAIKEIIFQQYSGQFISATEEGEHEMKETLVELKSKTNDIDLNVRTLEKSVAVIENTIKINFENINKSLVDIKSSIDALSAPISSLSIQSVEAKSEISSIKTRLADLATNRKWLITTIIAGLGLAATIVKIIIG